MSLNGEKNVIPFDLIDCHYFDWEKYTFHAYHSSCNQVNICHNTQHLRNFLLSIVNLCFKVCSRCS